MVTPSSRSSPTSAAAPGSIASSRPARPIAPAPGLVVLAMTPHLLPQPVGDLARELARPSRVAPPLARDGHGERVDDPARPAAEHHDPVAEPDRRADVGREEQHG